MISRVSLKKIPARQSLLESYGELDRFISREYIEEFGRLLMESVRDPSVVSCDAYLAPNAKSLTAKRWAKASNLENVIPGCIDEVIFQFLLAIDDGSLQFYFKSRDGALVNLCAQGEGELSGEPMTSVDVAQNIRKKGFLTNL